VMDACPICGRKCKNLGAHVARAHLGLDAVLRELRQVRMWLERLEAAVAQLAGDLSSTRAELARLRRLVEALSTPQAPEGRGDRG